VGNQGKPSFFGGREGFLLESLFHRNRMIKKPKLPCCGVKEIRDLTPRQRQDQEE
jgi:hypothetical protein